MPRIFSSSIKRFALILIAVVILPLILQGCASDKECWEPDFSEPPVDDKWDSEQEKKK